jgi:hypothetical protein
MTAHYINCSAILPHYKCLSYVTSEMSQPMIKFVLLIRFISQQLDIGSTRTIIVTKYVPYIIREQDTQHNTQQENTTHQLKDICASRGPTYV